MEKETGKKGIGIQPSYHKSAKNEGKGMSVRPATYTNRKEKGSGPDNKAAYDKKGKDLHV